VEENDTHENTSELASLQMGIRSFVPLPVTNRLMDAVWSRRFRLDTLKGGRRSSDRRLRLSLRYRRGQAMSLGIAAIGCTILAVANMCCSEIPAQTREADSPANRLATILVSDGWQCSEKDGPFVQGAYGFTFYPDGRVVSRAQSDTPVGRPLCGSWTIVSDETHSPYLRIGQDCYYIAGDWSLSYAEATDELVLRSVKAQSEIRLTRRKGQRLECDR
jgi:hypothetical protein